jgi:hypothetical protein
MVGSCLASIRKDYISETEQMEHQYKGGINKHSRPADIRVGNHNVDLIHHLVFRYEA